MPKNFENATVSLCISNSPDGTRLILYRLRRDGTKAKTILLSRRASLASASEEYILSRFRLLLGYNEDGRQCALGPVVSYQAPQS